jgi:hypothetical protein
VPAGADLARYREQLARLDPVGVIGGAKAAFFFQYGEEDKYTPRENFVSLYLAAPSPKRIATYATGHEMAAEAVRRDRAVWVAEQLGLPPSS